MSHQPSKPELYVCRNCHVVSAGEREAPEGPSNPPGECGACGAERSTFVEAESFH